MTLTGILNSGSVIVLVLSLSPSLSSCCCCCFKSNATAFHTWRWRFTVSPRVASPVSLSPALLCPASCSPLHFAACCLALPRYDCQPENVEENYISKRVLAVEGANRALLPNGGGGRGNFKNYLLPETLTSFCSLLVISWGSCYL